MKDRAIRGLENWHALIDERNSSELSKKISNLATDLKDNLMIMISGEFNAGKSTFINAILGEEILTTDITPATAIITMLVYGEERKVIAHYTDGTSKEYETAWVEQLTAEREGAGAQIRSQLSYVEYQLPNEVLKTYTLIDSPGFTALHEHHSRVAESFMKRADIAIWLFNSLSVGTATELTWLKKMYSLEVPIYGVVNAIDRIEDEDLESFLEFNLRRVQPFIKKLYGISARDILNGQINNNPEEFEWGNAKDLIELFKQFEPAHIRKIEEFYRKLNPVLEEQVQLLKEKKATFEFADNLFKLKAFQNTNYPKFEEMALKYQTLYHDGKKIGHEWNEFVNENYYKEGFTKKVIFNLAELNYLERKWSSEIEPVLLKREKEYKKLKQKAEELEEAHHNLFVEWQRANSSIRHIVKKNIIFLKEKKYNESVENWHIQYQEFNEGQDDIRKLVVPFNQSVERIVNKKILIYQEDMNSLKKRLKEIQSSISDSIANTDLSTATNFKNHLIFTEGFKNKVLNYFKTDIVEIEKSSFYQKEIMLSTDVNNLYGNFDFLKFIDNYIQFLSYKIPIANLEAIDISAIPRYRYKKNPLPKLQLSLNSSKHFSKSFKLFFNKEFLSVIGTLLFVGIAYGSDYFKENEKYNESLDYNSLSSEMNSEFEEEIMTNESDSSDYIYEVEETEVDSDLDEELLIEESTEPVNEEPVYAISEFELQSFIEKYRAVYEEALNMEDFSTVSSYYDPAQPIYNSISDYINSIKGEGLTFEFISSSVLEVEDLGQGSFSVLVEEEFNLLDRDDGVESYNQREKEYIVKTLSADTLLIEDIITLDKSSELTNEGYSLTETVDFVSPEDISQMMTKYYADLELAFNEYGFYYIEEYYAYDGKEYSPTVAYIEKANNENMTMKNHYVSVTSVEIYDTNHYIATLEMEDEYRYQEGNSDIKKIQAEYLIRVTEEAEMKIDEILNLNIVEKIEF
ncbi:Bacterial dynamin-like protein [Planococcus massiliensis]|uniref:Bacterial dynamin-like protein n=1 Tax=Planococcus massiliensis TaxID=1499687 RepID=A0A098EJR4_9BACL|nr:dynamin family protein [Planococcus massiliensis]CEG22040.1 Bacterial dynamin-like protein [Planococcus massiliensis]